MHSGCGIAYQNTDEKCIGKGTTWRKKIPIANTSLRREMSHPAAGRVIRWDRIYDVTELTLSTDGGYARRRPSLPA